ncbi:uncharacterized protein LOC144571820 [Carex rostrata]
MCWRRCQQETKMCQVVCMLGADETIRRSQEEIFGFCFRKLRRLQVKAKESPDFIAFGTIPNKTETGIFCIWFQLYYFDWEKIQEHDTLKVAVMFSEEAFIVVRKSFDPRKV